MAEPPPRFDPLGLLATLDRHRVAYIVVGGFARIVQGAEETTHSVDIVPSPKPDNLERLDAALGDLEAQRTGGGGLEPGAITDESVIELSTNRGELKIAPQPEGTGGYAEHPLVRETFVEAGQILGQDLWALVQDGPAEALNETVNTQPAMLTADVAVYRAWRAAGPETGSPRRCGRGLLCRDQTRTTPAADTRGAGD